MLVNLKQLAILSVLFVLTGAIPVQTGLKERSPDDLYAERRTPLEVGSPEFKDLWTNVNKVEKSPKITITGDKGSATSALKSKMLDEIRKNTALKAGVKSCEVIVKKKAKASLFSKMTGSGWSAGYSCITSAGATVKKDCAWYCPKA